ncbi:MAG: Mut7-C RNAse domain-containing protein [Sulfolobales archaeon]
MPRSFKVFVSLIRGCYIVVRIVVDNMLGNLARWLRVLGYDTEYSRKSQDADILNLAIRDDRVIITRDLGLHRRATKKNLKSVYIPPDLTEIADILALVAEKLGLSVEFDKGNTRCPLCNNKLSIAPKAQIASFVPPEVLNKYDTFWYCAKCRKVYWQGNHWKTISDTLEMVKNKLNRKIGGI